jgi:hypothetical protein
VVAREDHIGITGEMLAAAPVMPVATLYPILGDGIGQASVAGLALAALAVMVQRAARAIRDRPHPAVGA